MIIFVHLVLLLTGALKYPIKDQEQLIISLTGSYIASILICGILIGFNENSSRLLLGMKVAFLLNLSILAPAQIIYYACYGYIPWHGVSEISGKGMYFQVFGIEQVMILIVAGIIGYSILGLFAVLIGRAIYIIFRRLLKGFQKN